MKAALLFLLCISPQSENVIVPPKHTVILSWNYSLEAVTPDLVFRVYHSTDLSVPVKMWTVATVPNGTRSVELNADHPQEFFAITASNQFGESDFGTTTK